MADAIETNAFANSSDDELVVVCAIVDAVSRAEPRLIFEDAVWLGIVHAVKNEVIARAWNQATTMRKEVD